MANYDIIKPFEREPLSEKVIIDFHAKLRDRWAKNGFNYPIRLNRSEIPDIRLIQYYRNSNLWSVEEKMEQEDRNSSSTYTYYLFRVGSPSLSIRDV